MKRSSKQVKQQILSAVSQTTKRNVIIALTVIGLVVILGLGNDTKTGTETPSPELSGPYEVTRVIDGDTIIVDKYNKQETIRLIGIDTPEIDGPYTEAECFGDEASEFTRSLIEGEFVNLETDPSQDNRDQYDRLLRYVHLGNTNINKLLIDEGYAFEYTFRTSYRYQDEFMSAQEVARSADAGLWSDTTCGGSTAIESIDFEDVDNQIAVADTDCIHFSSAPDYIGAETCVIGAVDHVFVSRNDTTFINFCSDYGSCPFTSVVFRGDKDAFSDLQRLNGQDVQIDGRIDTHEGLPQIILREPEQLTVR